jgi:hypothetical protein
MAAQYKPEEPVAVAVVLQGPTVQNKFVHLKLAD